MKAIVRERFGPPVVLQLVDTDPPEVGASRGYEPGRSHPPSQTQPAPSLSSRARRAISRRRRRSAPRPRPERRPSPRWPKAPPVRQCRRCRPGWASGVRSWPSTATPARSRWPRSRPCRPEQKLTVDGIVGPQTWAALNKNPGGTYPAPTGLAVGGGQYRRSVKRQRQRPRSRISPACRPGVCGNRTGRACT